jgi:hypothetical protein
MIPSATVRSLNETVSISGSKIQYSCILLTSIKDGFAFPASWIWDLQKQHGKWRRDIIVTRAEIISRSLHMLWKCFHCYFEYYIWLYVHLSSLYNMSFRLFRLVYCKQDCGMSVVEIRNCLTMCGWLPFEDEARLNVILRIQSVPQREHHTSPLQRSTG